MKYCLMALALGAVMPFGFAPYDQVWLVVLSFTGLVWLVTRADRPLWTAWCFGLGWFGIGAWWLVPTLHTFGPLPWVLATFAVFLLGACLALFPLFMVFLTQNMVVREWQWLLAFPVSMVLVEWLRGVVLTGLPWTSLGSLLLETPWIAWIPSVGVYAGAGFIGLASVSLFLCLRRALWRAGLCGMGVLFGMAILSPDFADVGKGETATVRLVQANVSQDMKWDRAFLLETMERYAGLSESEDKAADIIIWPETATPFFIEQAPGWKVWLENAVTAWDTPLLWGGIRQEAGSDTAYNGLFSLNSAHQWDFRAKEHLVPFGEYVPSWIPFLRSLAPGIGDWQPGQDGGVLAVGKHRFGSLICYESMFPEIARARVLAGAEVLVNVTNDAWYGQTPAAWQHFQAAQMRAVETGRYVLRAANTGVTAVISPDGRIQAQLPWFEATALVSDFKYLGGQTLYVRWGNYVLLPAGMMALMLLCYAWRERRRAHAE